MSIHSIDSIAEAAREQNRNADGTFGNQLAAEAQVELVDPSWTGPEPDEPDETEGFDHTRISSLMGDDYYLDPERKVALPRINEDDTIAQIHHKLNRYLAKTQDVSFMDDAELASEAGFENDPDGEMPEHLRNEFGISPSDRVVVAKGTDGNPVYLSVSNTAKKTGSYRHRYGGGAFKVHNVAERTIQPKMQDEFAADHPDLDDKQVSQLFRRLNGSYRGKGHAYLWAEETLSRNSQFHLRLASRGTDREHHAPMSDDELREWVGSLDRDEDGAALVPTRDGRFNKLDTTGIEDDLAGTSGHATMVRTNAAYRTWISEKLADEYDYTLQRKYVRDNSGEGGARVFEQKKNVPQSHLDAAESSTFRATGDFRHVEVDSDTDLDKLSMVSREYEGLRRHLPRTESAPALRFRKTGRHQALGVYHPHVDNIAVDPRHPSSFLHEYTHHLDHTVGDRNLSSEEDFKPILRAAQRNVTTSDDPALNKKRDYYLTPTEVHARTMEMYFHWKQPGTSLNGDEAKYSSDAAYTTLAPMRDEIITYWDAKLTELGAEAPGGRR